jgi:hypothetical protein
MPSAVRSKLRKCANQAGRPVAVFPPHRVALRDHVPALPLQFSPASDVPGRGRRLRGRQPAVLLLLRVSAVVDKAHSHSSDQRPTRAIISR